MRTLVDIPDQDVQALDALSARKGESRSSLIRQAVRDFLASHSATDLDLAFGLWRDRPVDGLEYERRVREEW